MFWSRYLFIAAVVLTLGPVGAQAQNCALKRIASFDITRVSGGGVATVVTIDGSARKFIVDPSAIYSGVIHDAVADMNLKVEHLDSVQIYSDYGKQIDHYVDIPSFSMGGMKGTYLRFVEQPREGEPADIAGYIGTDILKKFDVDFDFAAMKLNLFSPDHCKGKVVYWTRDYVELPYATSLNGRIDVEVSLDGHDLQAVLDTSVDTSYIDARVADRTMGVDDRSPGVFPIASAKPGDLAQVQYRFKSLTLNGIAVSNPLFAIRRDQAEAAFERDEGKAASAIYGDTLDVVPLHIGLDILTKLHIYIAYGEREIYVTSANAGAPAVQ